ncbi:flavodoxin domain-containing protein [Thalassolituus hydrocarboniclasticus]|uniref:Flavodoxin domain-containing protein n=1 Tax=Thalassolituus hydrocarboniclasticus TaxID=2742796 RepID=A0ABY6A7J3_9GAMM|nr:flavodoxin domain-containing protein [Thalassolituus hydrocarboniclasticus]UXD86595.1 flavodoxin domain-containing protein [Thalassolituus hydrocarboniclasticus]
MSVIYLAVGSVTGTALIVAKAVKQQLEQAGHQVVLDEKPSVSALNASQCDAVLICTSTTGRGDLPAAIAPFYVELEEQFPLQNGKPFGVISLGDSSYDATFCGAGALFEERFFELQGSAPVPRVTIDATETVTPDEDALFWLSEWMEKAL